MEAMTTCDMCPTCNHKKAGRKPKYNNDDDRKRAKQEQTNKCLQRIYEKKTRTNNIKEGRTAYKFILGKSKQIEY